MTVTLPDIRIISHEIPEDSLEVFDESDNLFNHITIEDYTAFTQDQKSAMEQRAVDGGLLDRANQEARTAVDSLLRIMPGLEEYTLTVKEPAGPSELCHDLPNRPADGQGLSRAGQSGLVHHRQLVPPVVLHQSGGRIHCQGGAADDEHICAADSGHSPGDHVLLQPLIV